MAKISDNSVLPFIINDSAVSGRIIHLGSVINAILNRHDYPPPVATLLGQFIALGAGIATALKYDGIFTFQAKGNSVVPLMVVDITTTGNIRGYANINGDIPALEDCKNTLVKSLIGGGHMMFTVDQNSAERYQGIVELDGDTLEDCAKQYFEKSTQFESIYRIACKQTKIGWRAGCIGISKLPSEHTKRDTIIETENWQEKSVLLQSITDEELVESSLSANEILVRLYHTADVKVYPPTPLKDVCRCSFEKMHKILLNLDLDERTHLFDDQSSVDMQCQYCSTNHSFSTKDLGLQSA